MANAGWPSGADGPIFRLIYRSRSRIEAAGQQAELGGLFSQARANNKQHGLTGALLVLDDWFAQILEGDKTAVTDLYGKIEQDPRHDRIKLLDTTDQTDRLFARWAMARVSPGGEPDIPLIAHAQGIVPAAGHKITPQQEFVLGFMRDSIRDAPVA